jgi:hypothetical protein
MKNLSEHIVRITNGIVSMEVALPHHSEGYYRGARFDWSGLICSLEYDGHTYIAPPFAYHDPLDSSCAVGTCEEFRACRPGVPDLLGYPEAVVGEGFLKIGVGIEEKPVEPCYNFGANYNILTFGTWDIVTADNSITFKQSLSLNEHHGYTYEKNITLLPNSAGFIIAHGLTNNGDDNLWINHYCHNFIRIDGEFIGTNYRITLPYQPVFDIQANQKLHYLEKDGFSVNVIKDYVDDNAMEGVNILGFDTEDALQNSFVIENLRTGAYISVKGDRPAVCNYIPCGKRFISVEPQIEMNIKKGETFKWSNYYEVGVR